MMKEVCASSSFSIFNSTTFKLEMRLWIREPFYIYKFDILICQTSQQLNFNINAFISQLDPLSINLRSCCLSLYSSVLCFLHQPHELTCLLLLECIPKWISIQSNLWRYQHRWQHKMWATAINDEDEFKWHTKVGVDLERTLYEYIQTCRLRNRFCWLASLSFLISFVLSESASSNFNWYRVLT